MNSISRFGTCLGVFFAFYLATTIMGLAGGSVGWDQVRTEIAKDDPFMADYIAKTFDMRPSGGAIRVGHDDQGNSLAPPLGVGSRIPPYEFPAKPRGAPGCYTLYITLEPNCFDNGKTTLWVLTLRKILPSD